MNPWSPIRNPEFYHWTTTTTAELILNSMQVSPYSFRVWNEKRVATKQIRTPETPTWDPHLTTKLPRPPGFSSLGLFYINLFPLLSSFVFFLSFVLSSVFLFSVEMSGASCNRDGNRTKKLQVFLGQTLSCHKNSTCKAFRFGGRSSHVDAGRF